MNSQIESGENKWDKKNYKFDWCTDVVARGLEILGDKHSCSEQCFHFCPVGLWSAKVP